MQPFCNNRATDSKHCHVAERGASCRIDTPRPNGADRDITTGNRVDDLLRLCVRTRSTRTRRAAQRVGLHRWRERVQIHEAVTPAVDA